MSKRDRPALRSQVSRLIAALMEDGKTRTIKEIAAAIAKDVPPQLAWRTINRSRKEARKNKDGSYVNEDYERRGRLIQKDDHLGGVTVIVAHAFGNDQRQQYSRRYERVGRATYRINRQTSCR